MIVFGREGGRKYGKKQSSHCPGRAGHFVGGPGKIACIV